MNPLTNINNRINFLKNNIEDLTSKLYETKQMRKKLCPHTRIKLQTEYCITYSNGLRAPHDCFQPPKLICLDCGLNYSDKKAPENWEDRICETEIIEDEYIPEF